MPRQTKSSEPDVELGTFGKLNESTVSKPKSSESTTSITWLCGLVSFGILKLITMFPLSLSIVIFAGRTLDKYNRYKIISTLSNGQPAWPENMTMGDHNALLGTAVVALFMSSIGSVVSAPFDETVLFLAYTFVVPYLWERDVFISEAFSAEPSVRSTLRLWVCMTAESVGSDDIPYGAMCSDLASMKNISCIFITNASKLDSI